MHELLAGRLISTASKTCVGGDHVDLTSDSSTISGCEHIPQLRGGAELTDLLFQDSPRQHLYGNAAHITMLREVAALAVTTASNGWI